MPSRRIRLILALLSLACFTLLYLLPRRFAALEVYGISQLSPHLTHFAPPLLLALLILALTALLGRFYCSLLCPAGLVQELFHRLGGLLGLRRLGWKPPAPKTILLLALALFAGAGFMLLNNFLDPLGMFGRLLTAHHPAPTPVLTGPPPPPDAATLLVYALTLLGAVLLVLVPLFKGRWFCDRACPVGALLETAARLGGRRGLRLDAEKCVSCGTCEKICPVRTIDARRKTLDPERCLLCLDCVAACPVQAIGYSVKKRAISPERRGFLHSSLAAAAAGLFALARPVREKIALAGENSAAVAPPGSGGGLRHAARCVTCQYCVLACPVGIIQIKNPDLRPVLDYDRGYCQYECTDCTNSCPAGAIEPLKVEDKKLLRLATTRLVLDRCVVLTKNNSCGACAEVCPTHAVRMREVGQGRPTEPEFAPEFCLGCGACYHVCPAEPRAFVIAGLRRHERTAGVRTNGTEGTRSIGRPGSEEKKPEGGLQEFPF